MKRTRGSVAIIVIVALALSNISSVAWYKATASSRNKKVAEAAAQQTSAANEQAKVATDAAKAAEIKATEAKIAAEKLKADIDRERGQRDQIDQNVAGFVEGAKTAVEADPSPSQADLVAIGLLESAQQANTQKLTPQQREFWKKTVAGLISKNAEAEAKIRELDRKAQVDLATLTEVRARTEASERAVVTLTNQVKEQNTQLIAAAQYTAKLTEQAAKTSYEMKVWSDGGATWQSRFKAVLVLCGLALGISGFFWLKTHSLGETLKDAVAYGKHAESLAITSSEENHNKLANWWENDAKSIEAVRKIASNLRM